MKNIKVANQKLSKTIERFLELDNKEKGIFSEFSVMMTNPKRQEIIKLCGEKPRTISELKRALKIGYKSTWEHVKRLKDKNIIRTESKITNVGNVVYVHLNEIVRYQVDGGKIIIINTKKMKAYIS